MVRKIWSKGNWKTFTGKDFDHDKWKFVWEQDGISYFIPKKRRIAKVM